MSESGDPAVGRWIGGNDSHPDNAPRGGVRFAAEALGWWKAQGIFITRWPMRGKRYADCSSALIKRGRSRLKHDLESPFLFFLEDLVAVGRFFQRQMVAGVGLDSEEILIVSHEGH
jgi:hypothetical protein